MSYIRLPREVFPEDVWLALQKGEPNMMGRDAIDVIAQQQREAKAAGRLAPIWHASPDMADAMAEAAGCTEITQASDPAWLLVHGCLVFVNHDLEPGTLRRRREPKPGTAGEQESG